MGCCESSPENVIPLATITNPRYASSTLPLTSAENILLQQILTKVPAHCRQALVTLPPRPFLTAYQHYLISIYYLQRNDFQSAAISESDAIKALKLLLPGNKDHFIFIDLYNQLARCLVALDLLSIAVEGYQLALNMILKHTPTNYVAISEQYYEISLLYKVGTAWKTSIAYLTKAIDTARLRQEPDQEWIRKLEAERQLLMKKIVLNEPVFTVREIKPNPGESQADCHVRAFREMCEFNSKHGTLLYDIAEIERIPDKQTELQVTDEILNEVLDRLAEHLYSENALAEFKRGVCMSECFAIHIKLGFMKASSLSTVIIEAALTMIIDRMNSEEMPNDERYKTLKQAPVTISYTDNGSMSKKGVRVFFFKANKEQSNEKK